jgi:hypothetical protein
LGKEEKKKSREGGEYMRYEGNEGRIHLLFSILTEKISDRVRFPGLLQTM